LSRFETIASTLGHRELSKWLFEDHKVLLISLSVQCPLNNVLEEVRLYEGWLRVATPGYASVNDPDAHQYTLAILSAFFQVQTFAFE
jgi:hypothetical protein